jgi:hypothetical protein
MSNHCLERDGPFPGIFFFLEGNVMKFKNSVYLLACMIMLALLAGCATYDQSVTMLYHSAADDAGGSGTLYLAPAGLRSSSSDSDKVSWIIGNVQYDDWRQSGNVLSTVSPNEMVLDALNSELTIAGYKVMEVNSLPTDVGKGIVVSLSNIKIDENSSVIKDQASCIVNVSLELWKNGNKLRKLDYQSKFSDQALSVDNMTFLQTVLQNAMQDVMKQAVPDIIRHMETES